MSVVVAVRNGERFLGEALGSILGQTWQSLEIIVVDGHSTDQTPAIVRSFRQARHVVQPGRGIGNAYNTGIAEAHGDFIAFLSHDDLWTPHKIATQMRVMQDSPDIGFAVGHVRFFLEPGSRLPPGFRPALLEGTHPACIMELLLARRTVFDSVGPFDGALSSGEDVDWFSRARDLGVRHAVVPDVVLHKRVHDTNLSLNDPATNTILLDVVRRSIARKRQAPPEHIEMISGAGGTISVVIPVFNGKTYLREAIDSVLAQTHPPLEVIVVDDGSTDGSLAEAQAYPEPVRTLTQAHTGAAAARNLGVQASRGDLLAFLDADDRWPAFKLQSQCDLLQRRPDLDAVLGYVRQLRDGLEWHQGLARPRGVDGAVPGYVAGALLVRRDAFLRVGLFRTHWRTGEFIDWFARAAEMGLTFGVIPDVVLWRRIHTSNSGIHNRDAAVDYTRIVRESLRRRRSSAREQT